MRFGVLVRSIGRVGWGARARQRTPNLTTWLESTRDAVLCLALAQVWRARLAFPGQESADKSRPGLNKGAAILLLQGFRGRKDSADGIADLFWRSVRRSLLLDVLAD